MQQKNVLHRSSLFLLRYLLLLMPVSDFLAGSFVPAYGLYF
ncbi:hypothetical protein HMPREF1861_00948 [Corynebacterium kroppenstedtii]|nr:hypothetical protein HMPREF1861_00948 [Corynebacterium kroppenstedtii]